MIDGTLGFRVRLGADKGTDLVFGGVFLVGMDADLDGSLDLFIGGSNQGAAKDRKIRLWEPGTGANISPNTTSIVNPAALSFTETSLNYGWTAVSSASDPNATTTDVDGDGATDYFLSSSVAFTDIVQHLALQGISFTETSSVRYVAATSQQENALNQDLNGVPKTYDSNATWTQLGAVTVTYSAGGVMIPEPSSALLVLLSLLGLGGWQRQRCV